MCAVVVPDHEPSGDGQHRAGSQGGFVGGDPAAYTNLDSSDERPHHQPYFPWLRPGCQRYEKLFGIAFIRLCFFGYAKIEVVRVI